MLGSLVRTQPARGTIALPRLSPEPSKRARQRLGGSSTGSDSDTATRARPAATSAPAGPAAGRALSRYGLRHTDDALAALDLAVLRLYDTARRPGPRPDFTPDG